VERSCRTDDPRQGPERAEVGPPSEPLAVARDRGTVAVVGSPGEAGGVTGRTVAWLTGGRPGIGRVLGRSEEPLQVADPVAAIAARVDPVVAQAPGIAPGPHSVRVDAQEPGGLRHREGRVDGTGRERARQVVLTGGNVKSTAAAYQSHTSCQ